MSAGKGEYAQQCIKVARSRAEMIVAAKEFMRSEYPLDDPDTDKDRWFERLGLLVHFITEVFPE